MANPIIIPDQGELEWWKTALGLQTVPDMQMVLYKTFATAPLHSTVYADLTILASSGLVGQDVIKAATPLNQFTTPTTNGANAGETTVPQHTFTHNGLDGSHTIQGWAIVTASKLMAIRQLDAPYVMAANGDQLKITVNSFTLQSVNAP